MQVAHIIIQFSIVCRIRNCEKIDRQELTKNIAAVVGKEHPVDLVNPELVIIIEVIQVCVCNAEIPALVIYLFLQTLLVYLHDVGCQGLLRAEKVQHREPLWSE